MYQVSLTSAWAGQDAWAFQLSRLAKRSYVHSLKSDLWQERCISTHLVEDDAQGMLWAESEERLGRQFPYFKRLDHKERVCLEHLPSESPQEGRTS